MNAKTNLNTLNPRYAVVFTVELLLRIGAYGVHIYSDVELHPGYMQTS